MTDGRMDAVITQVGVGGIFSLLVIREVLTFVKTRNGKKNGVLPVVRVSEPPQECHDGLKDITRMCSELKKVSDETLTHSEKTFEMHDKHDAKGQPVWYTSPLTEAVEDQTKVIAALSENVTKQTATTEELLKAVRKLNGGKTDD
jgi:hypothetical protein